MQEFEGTLLLIEDDVTLAAALEHRLRRARYRVLHASSGRAALNILDARDPDLVILDLMLPDVPGEEVLDRVRAKGNTPVIIISAKCDESDRISTLTNGADDYIVKPLSLSELEARVEAVLRRSRIPSGGGGTDRCSVRVSHSELLGAGVVLTLSTREVWLNGEQLDLSPTEFRLLRALLERCGSAVSVEQIMRRVWGHERHGRHVVESHIHRLRQKIERDPADPERLVTVRGFGYRLVDRETTACGQPTDR